MLAFIWRKKKKKCFYVYYSNKSFNLFCLSQFRKKLHTSPWCGLFFLAQKHTSPRPTYCQVNFSCPSAKYCQYVREASMMRMLHWLFTALMANQGHFWWQAALVDPFTAQTKRSDSACYINNSSFKGKFLLKNLCVGETEQKGIKRGSRQKEWKTSMNVVLNCISRSLHAVFLCTETSRSHFSLATERFKIPTISIMTYSSSWHLQPARHWPRFFLHCEEQGQFLCGSMAQPGHISAQHVGH